MKMLFRLFSICLLFFGAASHAHAFSSTPKQTATIIYSGNLDGELEPCGCSEIGNFGGIMRRVTVIDELRQTNPNIFLISSGGLIVNEAPQDKIKSEYIFKGFAALDYDAIGIQHNDLAFGAEFAQKNRLPWTVNNTNIGSIPSFREINKGDVTLRFFQWLSESEHAAMGGVQTTAKDQALQQLKQQLQQAKQNNQLNILATTLTLEEAEKLLPLDLVDLLFIKANYETYGVPQKVGNTIVLQPGSRGMRLGRIVLQLSNGQIKSFKHDIIAMPKEIIDAPRMSDWYASYNEAATNFYKAKIASQKNLKEEDKLFAGESACKACHKKEHDIWFNTNHAEAYYVLMDVDKGYDPDCVGCHVLGMDQPGGFLDPMLTGEMMHVQCENCHGAAKQHVKSNGKVKTSNHNWQPEKMCQQCHVQKHSPEFNFKQYWPRIQHGK